MGELKDWFPVIIAGVVALAASYGNLRKGKVEAGIAGAKAGTDTAKSQYDIWEREWKNIITALERRVEAAEHDEREQYKQLVALEVKYDICAKKLIEMGLIK